MKESVTTTSDRRQLCNLPLSGGNLWAHLFPGVCHAVRAMQSSSLSAALLAIVCSHIAPELTWFVSLPSFFCRGCEKGVL